jgi:hypothetical protein
MDIIVDELKYNDKNIIFLFDFQDRSLTRITTTTYTTWNTTTYTIIT